MPQYNVKNSIRQLLRMKHKILLSGGFSPATKLFDDYEHQQRFILGVFGLTETVANIKILNHPPLSFTFCDNTQPLDMGNEIPFDGTQQSSWRENGRQYLMGTKLVHLRSVDEQVDLMYDALFKMAKKLYGGE